MNYDYMCDPNIDKRIKSICLEAESNYIISNSKPFNITKFEENNNQYDIGDNRTLTHSSTSRDSLHEEIKHFAQKEQIPPLNNIPINNTLTPKNTFLPNQNNYAQQNELKNIQKDNNNIQSPKNLEISKIPISNEYTYIKKKDNNLYLDKERINQINSSVKLKTLSNTNPIKLSVSFSSISSHRNNLNMPKLHQCPDFQVHNLNSSKSFLSSSGVSSSSCLECEIKELINNKSCFNRVLNTNFEQNKAINNLVLQSKKLISKKKYSSAYNILNEPIKNGLYHPDILYLYGETCRVLKLMEEAEKYLLVSLNFENHSPYNFYSLGMLYMEVGQYKYSNYFFKKFLTFSNHPQLHFYIGRNYHMLQKELKAVDQLTKAIELEAKNSEYYKLRAEVYKKIGREDLSRKDIANYEYLIKNKGN